MPRLTKQEQLEMFRAIRRFEIAVREHEFMGAVDQKDWPAIKREFREAGKALRDLVRR